MADPVLHHGFSREQKIGFIFMLIFAILTVSLGALQLRNTIYGPFVIRPKQTSSLETIATNDEARLKSIDTDHDAINDYDELYLYETSPYLPDTDSDSVNDKTEIDRGSDPLCPEGKQCAAEAALPAAPSTTFASPLIKESPTPTDVLNVTQQLSGNNPSQKEVSDIQKIIADPVQLRALILSTGKIDQASLDKIDDATLQKMAQTIFAGNGAEAQTSASVTATKTSSTSAQ